MDRRDINLAAIVMQMVFKDIKLCEITKNMTADKE